MSELAISRTAPLEGDADSQVRDFLFHEAEMLDRQQFHPWFDLLSRSLVYRVPVRTARTNADGKGFSKTSFFLDEDYASMKTRVVRISSEFAWAENPATRTRRMIGNIRVRSSSADAIECASNLAIYCYRGDASQPLVLTGEREDILVWEDNGWKLAKRIVLFDATVLGLESLSIFL